jgi:hypothetical protein
MRKVLVTGAELDMVVPQYGDRALNSYFRELTSASDLTKQ